MKLQALSLLIQYLMVDEGFRSKPYKDTVGKLTIGYGRNLEDRGITEREAYKLLKNDAYEVMTQLDKVFPWWSTLTASRQCAVANMGFNLGIKGLLKFKRMLKALEEKKYHTAAEEALDSKWAKQVGDRAERIANIIRWG